MSDGALQFDGPDDYVTIADDANLDMVSELTVEAWVRLDSVDNEYDTILTKGSPVPFRGYERYALFRTRTGDGTQSWRGKFSLAVETTEGRSVARSPFVSNAAIEGCSFKEEIVMQEIAA